MDDSGNDTNPFRRLAEREREEQAKSRSGSTGFGAKPSSNAELERPINQSGYTSDASYSRIVDNYADSLDQNSPGSSSSSDEEDEELVLMDIPSAVTSVTSSQVNNSEIEVPSSEQSETALQPQIRQDTVSNATSSISQSDQYYPPRPARPPKLPQRHYNRDPPSSTENAQTAASNSFKKVSHLDPGTSSTVANYSFSGVTGNRYGSFPTRPPKKTPEINIVTTPKTAPQLPRRSSQYSDISVPTNDQNRLESSHNIPENNPSTPAVLSPNTSTRRNSSSRPISPSIASLQSVYTNNMSQPNNVLPLISIDMAGTTSPPLPPKPALPPKPPKRLGSRNNNSAYELLDTYNRRVSVSSVNDDSRSSRNSSLSSNLDPQTLRELGITEEMINQQRAIEERIQRERNENSFQALPSVSPLQEEEVSSSTIQTSLTVNDNASILSTNSAGNIPDDVSQLEIPTSLSRSQSNASGHSSFDNNSMTSTEVSIDRFAAGEELTEEQFLSYLPPVPSYREHANETEISIPDGKAIDMANINESHPDYDPPEYTPVSESLKKIIRRPQFSQTGGDNMSYRRDQQRLEREQSYRLQAQQNLSLPRRQTPSNRGRSSLSSSSVNIPRRRVPPLPLDYSSNLTRHQSQR